MNKVEIYTHPACGYCHRAKGLLKLRCIAFNELNVGSNPQLMTEMVERTGGRTFPQIVINERAIGGFDALHDLDKRNELQGLLAH